jgi:hypothetical protein
MWSQLLPGLAQNGFAEFLEQNYTVIIIFILLVIIAAGIPVLLTLWNRHKENTLLYNVIKGTARLDATINSGSSILSVNLQLKNICRNSIVIEALSARLVTSPGNEHLRKEVVVFEPKGASPYRQPLPVGDDINFNAQFESQIKFDRDRYEHALLVVRVTSAEILPYEKYHLLELKK